jgi:hypothetical protein
MDIKVLGTGCANCENTIALIDRAQGFFRREMA